MADQRIDQSVMTHPRAHSRAVFWDRLVLAAVACFAVVAALTSARPAAAQERPLLDPATGQTLRFQVPPPPSPEEVLLLQLRDGSVRWGSIVAHDPELIDFTLLSNGGQARVPWTLLDPRQAEELRNKFGYVELEAEEALVDAERELFGSTHPELGCFLLSLWGLPTDLAQAVRTSHERPDATSHPANVVRIARLLALDAQHATAIGSPHVDLVDETLATMLDAARRPEHERTPS